MTAEPAPVQAGAIDPVQVVVTCNESGIPLLTALRELGVDRASFYQELKYAVFDEKISRAAIYFSFGSDAGEFEEIISSASTKYAAPHLVHDEIVLLAEPRLGKGIFDKHDLDFYLRCRDCYGDFQRLIVICERNISAGTFAVLEITYGKNWIAKVDSAKRKIWAAVREDFRTSSAELPIHEFSSLPDLREIITSSNHWTHFNQHLPAAYCDKGKLKALFNEFLIPTRNIIFHPTRTGALTHTHMKDLLGTSRGLHISQWRGIAEHLRMTGFCELPLPTWY